MILLLSILILLASGTALQTTDGGRKSPEPKMRTFSIRSTIEIDKIPEGAKRLDLWIPYPLESPYQEISGVRIDAPYPHEIRREEKYGDRMVYFSVPEPPGSFDVSMSYSVSRTENDRGDRGPLSREGMDWTLEPARLIPLSAAAKEIALTHADPKASPAEQARSLYLHTIEHMSYDKTGVGWGNGDFQYACDARRGNCTDYHSYFIGLCRNLGIPAFFEIGFSIPAEKTAGEITGYHCWAYFWDTRKWMPVDISEADKHPEMKNYFFGHHDTNRIALTRGRDIVLSPPQRGEPLNYFVYPYAEVDGLPLRGIKQTVRFKESVGL